MKSVLKEFLWLALTLLLGAIGLVIGGMIGQTAFAATTAPVPARLPCVWDITFYALGEKIRKVSNHAWVLTEEEVANLFGPFVEGHLFVAPGSSYTCGTKTVTIATRPRPQGSLLLLQGQVSR